MNVHEIEYQLENLAQSDPDYVVDVLEISSEELIMAFPLKARNYILDEFTESDDE